MKAIRSHFLMIAIFWSLLLVQLADTHAAAVTLSISGVGSGTLGGNEFTDRTFVWSLTYDTSDYSGVWGENDPIFLHVVSVITLEGFPAPIHVTQEHGLWVENYIHMYLAPVFMVNGEPDPLQTNILTLTGESPWNGFTIPFHETNIPDTADDFNQFLNLATDQGLLSMPTGMVTAVDATSNATSYATWVASINWNGGNSSPASDPDHDGVVNLMEYALGGNPISAASAPSPEVDVSSLKLRIKFLRAQPDINYTVQASSNLATWDDIVYTPTALGTTQVVSDTVDLTNNSRRFLRLRVSQQ